MSQETFSYDVPGCVRKFTGKERDSESGLDNFGKRYDSSSLGRFMTCRSPKPYAESLPTVGHS